MPVQEVTDLNEFNAIIKQSSLTVVDFSATWCGPCRKIGPVFTALADETPGVTFVKVDVDEGEEIASECDVQAMPTFKFYKNGAEIANFTGANEAKLREMIKQHA